MIREPGYVIKSVKTNDIFVTGSRIIDFETHMEGQLGPQPGNFDFILQDLFFEIENLA